jgi:hypothetical protein
MIGFSTLFTELGHLFGGCVSENNTAGTTVPLNVQNVINDVANKDQTYQQIVAPVASIPDAVAGQAAGINGSFAGVAANILITVVSDDNPQADTTLRTALVELIRQMNVGVSTVQSNVPSAPVVVQTVGSNDTVVVASIVREDGLVNENVIPETLLLKVATVATTAGGQTSLALTSVAANPNLAFNWPGGSARNVTLNSLTAAGTALLVNGGFDTEQDPNSTGVQGATNMPTGWSANTTDATPGPSGTVRMSLTEVQRIVIGGTTPASGYYQIVYQNAAGKQQVTTQLPWNATGGQVQSALNALTGLGLVGVVTTGTSPLFQHDITFNGVAGSPTLVTVIDRTGPGGTTFTITRPTTGGIAYQGRALQFASNGSQLTKIYQPVTLTPKTCYTFCGRFRRSTGAVAGTILIELVDGFTGAVINDDKGTANSLSISVAGLTTAFAGKTAVFRTPTNLPSLVFLRINTSVLITNTESCYMDSFVLTAATQIYPGGPYLSAFAGGGLKDYASPSGPADPLLADYWTIKDANLWSNAGASKTVSGAVADPASGFVKLTITAHGFYNGAQVTVAGVGGTTEANGTWFFSVVDANHIILTGVAFVNAFSSNGTAVPLVAGFQSWFERAFNMRAMNLLLPSSGSPTISDALIV